MSKPKVIIYVSGGTVQDVCAPEPMDVLVVDYDDIEAGDTPRIGLAVGWDDDCDADWQAAQ